MKRTLAIIFAGITWFALILQLFLAIKNQITPTHETLIRFFSYFTILTNSLVAVYFTFQARNPNNNRFSQTGKLSAITVYILVVGLVYQVVLRSTWNPEGMAKLTDELLHSVIPLMTLFYWVLYEKKQKLSWSQIPSWLIYPALYLAYIMFRGYLSGFYPYPFVNVTEIGYNQTLLNSFFVLLVFVGLSGLLIFVGRRLK
ncbi:Pr6Pr family membrane protein [Belliella sp. DSM 111904]|uniref:Pr6Pr family membrane protein n=1 Tax=Belliella filtrata TaxID=2923435 RepID=A0ABS9V0Z4_9BACT|nr:Pr6Pr family membrane protein [Belliella filtrata]MCH7410084.1 Pr6Pr family membrane protein [Belliella filtrata]